MSFKCDQLSAVATEIQEIGRRTSLVPADITIGESTRHCRRARGMDVDWIMAVNVRGTFLCYDYAATQMMTQGHGGRIIGASSIAGKYGFPSWSAYAASKIAIKGLAQTAGSDCTVFIPHALVVNNR
ncbi:hypothetical protein L210DRAFT_3510775 [Boletus edulis BED1]|uniref:Uncharacterized protein n=1 Tax=Boletus edulis BED1 TaxID=1328754 RepID=A0AAD4BCJ5_BOLED|nr:hypothetical protein L210DRAFT_3510775 [Boletus edulis BED1]